MLLCACAVLCWIVCAPLCFVFVCLCSCCFVCSLSCWFAGLRFHVFNNVFVCLCANSCLFVGVLPFFLSLCVCLQGLPLHGCLHVCLREVYFCAFQLVCSRACVFVIVFYVLMCLRCSVVACLCPFFCRAWILRARVLGAFACSACSCVCVCALA